MNKKLYSLVLGAAGLVGCTTTEYTPIDLSDMLADGNISRSDASAFEITSASIRLRADSLEAKKKQSYMALLGDLDKVKTFYRDNVKLKVFPVFDFWSPGPEKDLNGSKFSGVTHEITYGALIKAIGEKKASSLLERTTGKWTSTGGDRASAEAKYVRVTRAELGTVFSDNPEIVEIVNGITNSKFCEVVPYTFAIGAIEDAGTQVTPEFVGSLSSLKALASPQSKEPEEKREGQ